MTEANQRNVLAILLRKPEQAAKAFSRAPIETFQGDLRLVAEAIQGLRVGRNPVDPTTVMDEMKRRGTITRVGPAFVHQIDAEYISDATLDYHLDAIADATRLRKLAGIGDRITALTTASDADSRQIAHHAAEKIQAILDNIEAEQDITTQTLREFLSGEDDPYDWVIPGLIERTNRVILTGAEGLGKALDVSTPIPTPSGWSTMGALKVGDTVFAPDGTPTLIAAATETMNDRPCYRVTFSDGASIVADADHMWVTETLAAREAHTKAARRNEVTMPRGIDQRHKRVHFPDVVTTAEMANTLHARNGHAVNHSVPTCAPLQYPTKRQLVDPYVLGAWLGDGTSSSANITTHPDDEEIISRIRSTGLTVTYRDHYTWSISKKEERSSRVAMVDEAVSNGTSQRAAERQFGIGRRKGANDFLGSLQSDLRGIGVLGNKHIPSEYMHGSVAQRLALLQGLMDTDGTIGVSSGSGRGNGAATCEFSVVNERLAADVRELLLGMGIKVTWKEGDAKLYGRVVGTRYRLAFQTGLPVFHLRRKAERVTPLRTRRSTLRYVVSVEKVKPVPVRCIQVDREDGMFLAGRECVPTHNSALLRQMAIGAAAGIHPFTRERMTPQRVLYVDLENGVRQMRRALRPLRQAAINQHGDPNENMFIETVSGFNLRDPADELWLISRVVALQPSLLVTGSLYKMYTGNPNEEGPALDVQRVIDRCRAAADCAVIIEAHAGKSTDGPGGKRNVAPAGTSAWLRWPETGIGIRPADEYTEENRMVDVVAWRGDRDSKTWPRQLMAGSSFPWKTVERPDQSWSPSQNHIGETA